MRLVQRPASLLLSNRSGDSHNALLPHPDELCRPDHPASPFLLLARNHWRPFILLLCTLTLLAASLHLLHPATTPDHLHHFLNQDLITSTHDHSLPHHAVGLHSLDHGHSRTLPDNTFHPARSQELYPDHGKLVRTSSIGRKSSSIGVDRSSPNPERDIPAHEYVAPSSSHVSNNADNAARCDGKRVFMYDLPSEFNTAILAECNRKMVSWLDFCRHIQHHGFGRQIKEPGWEDWYETDPYMLEPIFHHKMKAYPCLVKEPHSADAFFLPYYSGLDALRYLYGQNISQSGEQGLPLLRWLREFGHSYDRRGGRSPGDQVVVVAASVDPDFYWRRKGGHDHFIVMGRTSWDFTRPLGSQGPGWGTSLASLPQMENVTALFLERRPWRWSEQAIPYPTAFHPRSDTTLRAWQQRVLAANRTFLSAFVGAPRASTKQGDQASIRQAALQQCLSAATGSSACTLIDCSKIKCAHNPVVIAERLLHADFCLQPPGDTATRRSTFDGILSGCIPVFFNEDSAYTQYTWHLPPAVEVEDAKAYSVLVKSEDIDRIQEVLGQIPKERIIEMRALIVNRLLPDIIYADPMACDLRDAFQISVESMLKRAAQAPPLTLSAS